jgi:hypothetical protein
MTFQLQKKKTSTWFNDVSYGTLVLVASDSRGKENSETVQTKQLDLA